MDCISLVWNGDKWMVCKQGNEFLRSVNKGNLFIS